MKVWRIFKKNKTRKLMPRFSHPLGSLSWLFIWTRFISSLHHRKLVHANISNFCAEQTREICLRIILIKTILWEVLVKFFLKLLFSICVLFFFVSLNSYHEVTTPIFLVKSVSNEWSSMIVIPTILHKPFPVEKRKKNSSWTYAVSYAPSIFRPILSVRELLGNFW